MIGYVNKINKSCVTPPLTSLKNNKLYQQNYSKFLLSRLSIAVSLVIAFGDLYPNAVSADTNLSTLGLSNCSASSCTLTSADDVSTADSPTYVGNTSGVTLILNGVALPDSLQLAAGYTNSGANTTGNSVYVLGNTDLTSTELRGGTPDSGNDFTTGNTLYFGNGTTSWDRGNNDLYIGTVSFFETIKFNSVVWNKTITINDWNVVGINKIDASQVNFTGVDSLSNGDSYEMLKVNMVTVNDSSTEGVALTTTESTYTIGTTVEGTGTVSLVKTDQGGYDSVSVTYTVGSSGSAKASSQSHAAAMTASAATVALTQGADTTSNALSNLSNSGVTGIQAFSSVGGGTARVETGSHININSLNFSVGVGTNNNTDYGLFSIGGAFEAGYGKFKNHYNAGTAEPYVKKSGDVHYYGVALLSNLTLENLWHFNGALRVGRIESSQNKALYNAATGQTYDIDIGSVYYGAELGVGKIIKIDDSNSLDIYGKYFYLYQDGDKFNAGGKYEVSSINSHRLRIAGRYTHDFTPLTSIYGGLGIEHEFDGKAKFKADGYWGEPSKTKGTRGYGEVGVTIKPASAAGLNFDLGVKTLCGEEYRGIWATAEVKYLF